MPHFKGQDLAFRMRYQQRRRIFRGSVPRTIGIASLLVIKNNVAGDFAAHFINVEIDSWKALILPSQLPANEELA
jgi:hypothetical protein